MLCNLYKKEKEQPSSDYSGTVCLLLSYLMAENRMEDIDSGISVCYFF